MRSTTNSDGNHTQVSPRLNLRYDFARRCAAVCARRGVSRRHNTSRSGASKKPSSTRIPRRCLSTRSSGSSTTRRAACGSASRPTASAGRPRRRISTTQLDPLALLPDLDARSRARRAAALRSERTRAGVRKPISEHFTGWGTLAWARVADDFRAGGDVLRSWDQPLSVTAGLAWKGSRASVSALGGLAPRLAAHARCDSSRCKSGMRNSARWSDFFTLDLRGSWTWKFASGDLSVVVDLTNATNRRNECCAGAGSFRGDRRRSRRRSITGCRRSSTSDSPTAGAVRR